MKVFKVFVYGLSLLFFVLLGIDLCNGCKSSSTDLSTRLEHANYVKADALDDLYDNFFDKASTFPMHASTAIVPTSIQNPFEKKFNVYPSTKKNRLSSAIFEPTIHKNLGRNDMSVVEIKSPNSFQGTTEQNVSQPTIETVNLKALEDVNALSLGSSINAANKLRDRQIKIRRNMERTKTLNNLRARVLYLRWLLNEDNCIAEN